MPTVILLIPPSVQHHPCCCACFSPVSSGSLLLDKISINSISFLSFFGFRATPSLGSTLRNHSSGTWGREPLVPTYYNPEDITFFLKTHESHHLHPNWPWVLTGWISPEGPPSSLPGLVPLQTVHSVRTRPSPSHHWLPTFSL